MLQRRAEADAQRQARQDKQRQLDEKQKAYSATPSDGQQEVQQLVCFGYGQLIVSVSRFVYLLGVAIV